MPQDSQYAPTNEWLIPRLNTPGQFFTFALLTATALISLTPETVAARKVKSKDPVWEKEVPPAVARKTVIASTAIIAPISIETFRPSSWVLPMPESRATIRQESNQKYIEIIQTIRNKTVYDSAEINPKLDQLCKNALQWVVYAEWSLARNNHIIKVFSQENFKIMCLTKEKMNEYTGTTEGEIPATFFAAYDPKTSERENMVKLLVNDKDFSGHRDQRIAAIRYVFWRARHYQLHQYKPCQVETVLRSTFPIFPVTSDTIQRYNEALDKGDSRIKEFMQLRWRNKIKERLTTQQSDILKAHEQACQGILLKPLQHEATKGLIAQLKQQYPQRFSKEFSMDFSIGAVIEEIGVTKVLEFYYIMNTAGLLIQPMDEQQMLILLPDHIRFVLTHELYNDNDAGKILAKRDAYLREAIPDETFKTFYPEAYQMQQDYEAYCEPDDRKYSP